VKHQSHKKTSQRTADDPRPDETMASEPRDPGDESSEAGEARLAEGPGAAMDAESEAEIAPAVDYKDRWLRSEAELQTYRRRARREIEDARRDAQDAVLLDLVAWLDDLERALDASRESGALPSWTEGVSLALQKGRETLERHGVTVVDPLRERFDPHFHEAILEIDPPEGFDPGTVVQVVQKGYRRGSRPLRAARVVVARSDSSRSS
jgi:molecular chaperone GrpE